MIETKTGISTDGIEWGTAADVTANTPILLYFQVNTRECDRIDFLFPVSNEDVAGNKAITDLKTWRKDSTAMTVLSPVKGLNNPYKGQNTFRITFKSGPVTSFFVQLAIKTIAVEVLSTALCTITYFKKENDQYIKHGDIDTFTVNISRIVTAPEIEYFTTSAAIGSTGEKFTLDWAVKNANKTTLNEVAYTKRHVEECQFDKLITTYTLCATNALGEATANITVYGGPKIRVDNISAFDGKLVNLVNDADNKLYALVQAFDNVWLWESTDGANWKKTTVSFNNKVPLECAGSSSVFYNNKIYLLGGSRYDANFRSNEVYFYDLTRPSSGWQKDKDGLFDARMGQGVVVVHNDGNKTGEIYLLGGHGPKGTFNDMYIFNETDGWRKENVFLPGGLCMQSVVYDGEKIQMYGGFSGGPGTPDQKLTDFSTYDPGTKAWEKRKWNSTNPDAEIYKRKFVTCAAARYNGREFIFGIYRFGDVLHHLAAQLHSNDMRLENYETIQMMRFKNYCTSVQAVVFKNVVWFSIVSDEGELISEKLGYFLYGE